MNVVIERLNTYDGSSYFWQATTNDDAGFYISGNANTYRSACRRAKKAMKRLDGIGWLSCKPRT